MSDTDSTDPTETLRAEIEQLKMANHYLRAGLDLVNESVIMLEPKPVDGRGPRIIFNNMPAACLVGMEPAKGLRGLYLADLVQSERDVVALMGALADAAQSGGAECQATIQTRYNQGSQLCCWRIKALHNPMRQVLNFTITILAVPNEITTNRPKTAKDLDGQTEHLRTKNLASLAMGIAHDVNNLLGPITAQLSLIIPSIDQRSELAETLESVMQAVKRAKSFTGQIVKAAKAKQSDPHPCNLVELIKDAVSLAQAGSNVKVRSSIASDLKPAMADPVQITQVLQNLIINGMQAMPSGGVMDVEAGNVVIQRGNHPTLNPGSYLQIIVRDRGAGISPENMSRLWEGFTTKIDGNGIGLPTCKHIVDEHKGAIQCDSTLHIGTEFRVYLPTAIELKASMPTPTTTSGSTGRGLRPGRGNVMLVDDEEHIRKIAATILKVCGYTPIECDNGELAIRTYQQMHRSGRPVHAVLMDLTLAGGMGGTEIADEIWRFDPTARIIVSSGSVTNDVQLSFLSQGFFAILPKPYEAQELSQVMHDAIMERDTATSRSTGV
jgi:signal transduction histidine kinase/CheY-like chemotaxis protein